MPNYTIGTMGGPVSDSEENGRGLVYSVELSEFPSDEDWMQVKRRALVTAGRDPVKPPDGNWKRGILRARHSPIRYLRFSFDITCPSFVATHLARHIHAQPYIQSQRNDRQSDYDRNAARQDTPVRMIWDLNAEALMTVCQKRLCSQADPTTRAVVQAMARQVLYVCPEFTGLLAPTCVRYGICDEMHPCGRLQHDS